MKRVLIISYYWPPAGGISVHRSLKIAKYLRFFGWEPVIYTADNAQYPYFDKGNFKDVPDNIECLKRPIVEPFNLFKKISGRRKSESLNNIVHVRGKRQSLIDKIAIWIRGNFFIPDARSLWIKPSVQFLLNYLQDHSIDAIFSDGPPHTNTMIACKLKQSTGIPWLADFQDPWTQVDYLKLFPLTKWAHSKHRRLEQETFKTANKITIVSPSWKRDLESIGAKNVEVIYWGFDDEDFTSISPVLDKDFTITHTGLLGFDRNVEILFEVLQSLKKSIPGFEDNLKLQLAGQVDFSVLETIQKYGLEKNLVNFGIVDRSKSLHMISNSQLLILPLNKAENVYGRIPGKFFEYMRSRRPILSFGPEDGDVSKIIKRTESGFNFKYDDKQGLLEKLTEFYNQYNHGGIKNCSSDISEFSIKEQTRKVADLLNKITDE